MDQIPPSTGRRPSPTATHLEEAMLAEVRGVLERHRHACVGRPEVEMRRLCLLALEREQTVAIAYREEAVAAHVDSLALSAELRATIRQTLVWIWKDEALHSEFMRGTLMRAGGFLPTAVVYAHQLQGIVSGWVTSTGNHRDPRTAPFQTRVAAAMILIGVMTRRVPPALRQELRFQSFRRYCALNIVLEKTAELAYGRMVEVAIEEEHRETFARIRHDEQRHTEAFQVLCDAITDDGRLAEGWTDNRVIAALASLSPWFVPAASRPTAAITARPRAFGSGAPVAVRSGRSDDERIDVLDRCLDAAGLDTIAVNASIAAVRVSFMLGYDCADRSNVNDTVLLDALARYLRRHGVADVAVLEAPTVYGDLFDHRSVDEVARYFGFSSDAYRVVDISEDLRPLPFERGLVEQTISSTWVDADLRIVMSKLRTDPTEYAHLSLSSLEGTTGSIDDTVYAGRRIDFRSATMMALDVAPPDFAVIDAWSPVADGPFGVMGCRRPADVRSVYAGRDALAVDEAVLADLGVSDPRRAPIVRRAHHWFGLPVGEAPVDGTRPPLHDRLRGAHASRVWRAFGTISYPVYVYLSDSGGRFGPAMDTVAFPPIGRPSRVTRMSRWAAQHAFGLRAPNARARWSGRR